MIKNNKELIVLAIVALFVTAGIIVTCNHFNSDNNVTQPVVSVEEGNGVYIKTITYPSGDFRQFNNRSELISTSFENETIYFGGDQYGN